MPPLCNPRKFLAAIQQVPERLGWYWAIGSVEWYQSEDRYRFCALYGPGLDILRGSQYGRVLLDLRGIVVDVSVVKGEKRRLCMPLPKELNNVWARLYGGCHVGYIVPKRLFLLLTDQIITDYLITYVYRRPIAPRFQTQ